MSEEKAVCCSPMLSLCDLGELKCQRANKLMIFGTFSSSCRATSASQLGSSPEAFASGGEKSCLAAKAKKRQKGKRECLIYMLII